MRLSKRLFETRRDVSGNVELASHQLTLRAGLARQVASGIYGLTPIGVRALRRLEAVVREQMEAIGGQEVLLPVVNPRGLWEASGRYQSVDETLVRFSDRTRHDMVLAMTHEEAATDLVQALVKSRRQVPLLIFQIQTKFRDELRPRDGLVRLREFLMKDAYSFHLTPDDLDALYRRMLASYLRIYDRVGVPVVTVTSDSGLMGGDEAHEFMLVTAGGEDTLVLCRACGYAASREVAGGRVPPRTGSLPQCMQVRLQDTPGAITIDTLRARYGYAADTIVKNVYRLTGDGRVLVALIRGDQEVNEVKLARAAGTSVHPLSESEAVKRGLYPGFVGPDPGLAPDTLVIADDSIATEDAFVIGANRPGSHPVMDRPWRVQDTHCPQVPLARPDPRACPGSPMSRRWTSGCRGRGLTHSRPPVCARRSPCAARSSPLGPGSGSAETMGCPQRTSSGPPGAIFSPRSNHRLARTKVPEGRVSCAPVWGLSPASCLPGLVPGRERCAIGSAPAARVAPGRAPGPRERTKAASSPRSGRDRGHRSPARDRPWPAGDCPTIGPSPDPRTRFGWDSTPGRFGRWSWPIIGGGQRMVPDREVRGVGQVHPHDFLPSWVGNNAERSLARPMPVPRSPEGLFAAAAGMLPESDAQGAGLLRPHPRVAPSWGPAGQGLPWLTRPAGSTAAARGAGRWASQGPVFSPVGREAMAKLLGCSGLGEDEPAARLTDCPLAMYVRHPWWCIRAGDPSATPHTQSPPWETGPPGHRWDSQRRLAACVSMTRCARRSPS